MQVIYWQAKKSQCHHEIAESDGQLIFLMVQYIFLQDPSKCSLRVNDQWFAKSHCGR